MRNIDQKTTGDCPPDRALRRLVKVSEQRVKLLDILQTSDILEATRGLGLRALTNHDQQAVKLAERKTQSVRLHIAAALMPKREKSVEKIRIIWCRTVFVASPFSKFVQVGICRGGDATFWTNNWTNIPDSSWQSCDLRDHIADDVALDIRQAEVAAVVAVAEAFVVEAEQVQQGGVQVESTCNWPMPPRWGLNQGNAALLRALPWASTCNDVGVDAFRTLGPRQPI